MPLDSQIRKAAEEWISLDPNPLTRSIVEELVASGNEEELKRQLLSPPMTFGTAGLRSRMDVGPGFMNDLTVIQATQGLVRHLEASMSLEQLQHKGLVVGYDGRHNSSRFATWVAAVCISQFIPVYLFRKPVPTPLVAFSTHVCESACGIMVTASHNPAADNGYKVYRSDGAQIISPMDKDIANCIENEKMPWSGLGVLHEILTSFVNFGKNSHYRGKHFMSEDILNKDPNSIHATAIEREIVNRLVKDPTEALWSAYILHTTAAMNWTRSENIRWRNVSTVAGTDVPRIVYSAMHGVGGPLIAATFQAFSLPPPFVVNEQTLEPDPDFRTVKFPNPEEGKEALDLAFERAAEVGAQLILANDPDADRLAVAEVVAPALKNDAGRVTNMSEHWRIYTGNEIGSLLAHWIASNILKRHSTSDTVVSKPENDRYLFVNSIVSSGFLKRYVDGLNSSRPAGVSFEHKTAGTGFKNLANASRQWLAEHPEGKVAMGYEEAIGFMVNYENVRDKDGVSAAAVMAEFWSSARKRGRTLQDILHKELYDVYGWPVTFQGYYIVEPAASVPLFHRLRGSPNVGDLSMTAVMSQHLASTKLVELKGVTDHTLGFDGHGDALNDDAISTWVQGLSVDVAQVLHDKPGGFISYTFSTAEKGESVVIHLRQSGTEPKFKYYTEMFVKRQDECAGGREMLEKLVAEICEKFLGCSPQ